jgi:NAD-dependent deacetylase
MRYNLSGLELKTWHLSDFQSVMLDFMYKDSSNIMIIEPDNSTIDALVRILRRTRSILFITGAGISAESGIPTYRGIGGLYNVDTTEDGVAIEEALSASMLAENPALTWKYLAQIGIAVQSARHNRAHEVIAEMESRFHRVWTLTQNVDGFHRTAGSKNLIEAHGNMHSLSCTICKYKESLDEFDAIAIPPKCPRCGTLVRPDVVLFGELINGPGIEHLQSELEKGFDIVFSIGTTSVFPYIQAPIYMAKSGGNVAVEINPSETTISHVVDYRLAMPAGAALDEIWRRYQAANNS